MRGWPLTITGHPAASALAVSPPAVEKASGKLLAPKTATGPMGTSMRRTSGRGIGLASGSARVDDRLDVVAGVDDGGEGLELARRALELAAQAPLGQPGLGPGDGDDLVPRRAQPLGGAAQQRGAPRGIAQLAGAERLVRRGDGLVDVGAGGLFEGGPGSPVLGSTAWKVLDTGATVSGPAAQTNSACSSSTKPI